MIHVLLVFSGPNIYKNTFSKSCLGKNRKIKLVWKFHNKCEHLKLAKSDSKQRKQFENAQTLKNICCEIRNFLADNLASSCKLRDSSMVSWRALLKNLSVGSAIWISAKEVQTLVRREQIRYMHPKVQSWMYCIWRWWWHQEH